jgi:hypothetical protein
VLRRHVVPRQWFVTEHVREKFSCRYCEMITQPPAPFHAIARGFVGPSLLAMMLVEKYANHQPLNRQSEQYAREGSELSVSTMADHVGACAAALMPLLSYGGLIPIVAAGSTPPKPNSPGSIAATTASTTRTGLLSSMKSSRHSGNSVHWAAAPNQG